MAVSFAQFYFGLLKLDILAVAEEAMVFGPAHSPMTQELACPCSVGYMYSLKSGKSFLLLFWKFLMIIASLGSCKGLVDSLLIQGSLEEVCGNILSDSVISSMLDLLTTESSNQD